MAWMRSFITVATGRCGRRCHQEPLARLLRPLQTAASRPPGLCSPFPPSPLFGCARSYYSQFLLNFTVDDLLAAKGCRLLSNQAWVDPPLGAVVAVPLAQTGEGIAECELLKWFVEEGENVEEFQRLCEVQSDKATIEITSRYKGKIQQISFAPGDIVKVGETLLKIFVDGNQTSTPHSANLDNANDLGTKEPDQITEKALLNEENTRSVLATPSCRNLAKEYGLDINEIRGSGNNGRVLKEDVLNYASSKGINIGQSSGSDGVTREFSEFTEEKKSFLGHVEHWNFDDRKIQLRGYQRSMVKSMTMAAKVPHFYYLEEVNCDALIKLRAVFKEENTDPNVKHTYLPFLIKSLSFALIRHPLLNSSFTEETNEVVLKGSHNIGVAMATPFGLVVPNIKKVQSLSILEITKELSRLQLLALNNKLSHEDISGGTITLSNIGTIGGKFGTPLLNLPEVAIIALGRIQKLPRFKDDATVYPASITNIMVGADHRIVDGASVARFCNEWKLLIEKPELLVLHGR